MVRAHAPADADLAIGQQVYLGADEAAIHLFDGETEESLSLAG